MAAVHDKQRSSTSLGTKTIRRWTLENMGLFVKDAAFAHLWTPSECVVSFRKVFRLQIAHHKSSWFYRTVRSWASAAAAAIKKQQELA